MVGFLAKFSFWCYCWITYMYLLGQRTCITCITCTIWLHMWQLWHLMWCCFNLDYSLETKTCYKWSMFLTSFDVLYLLDLFISFCYFSCGISHLHFTLSSQAFLSIHKQVSKICTIISGYEIVMGRVPHTSSLTCGNPGVQCKFKSFSWLPSLLLPLSACNGSTDYMYTFQSKIKG